MNVPPKFNQICRLCLTLVDVDENDEILRKLSIFNSGPQLQPQKSPKSSIDKRSNESVRDENVQQQQPQINKNNKRSNEISISLSGGSVSVFNGFKEGESDGGGGDIAERIAECLSIKVSHFFHSNSVFICPQTS
jgi:hypothetical protein